jgi:hypothetical protein
MKLLVIPALLLSSIVFAADSEPTKAKPYPLDTCPISGKKLGDMGDAVGKTYQGQDVKFCCNGCPKKFEKDIPGNLEKIDAKAKEAAIKPVPAK